jgi:hypothetical protein
MIYVAVWKECEPLPAVAVTGRCRLLPLHGPLRRKSKAARHSKSGRCCGWRLAAKKLLPVRYSAAVAATKEQCADLLWRKGKRQSKQKAAGARAVERLASSGAMTGRSAVQWRAMQRSGGSGAKRSCSPQRSWAGLLARNALLVAMPLACEASRRRAESSSSGWRDACPHLLASSVTARYIAKASECA